MQVVYFQLLSKKIYHFRHNILCTIEMRLCRQGTA
jgi:hypothetical protein